MAQKVLQRLCVSIGSKKVAKGLRHVLMIEKVESVPLKSSSKKFNIVRGLTDWMIDWMDHPAQDLLSRDFDVMRGR